MIGRHYAGEIMDLSKFKPTPEDVAAIERALARIRTQRDAANIFASEIVIEPGDIRRAIKTRRLRDHLFGAGMFEDPAWDMLLELFASELEHRPVSVSALGIASMVAPTTGLRWINKLIEAGLFERRPDHLDRRRSHIELSEAARLAMRRYVAATRREGLIFA